MEIIVEENYEEMSQKAAKIAADFVKENPNCILGLATGSTPVRMYEILAEKYQNREISFKNVKTFNLDEYSGLLPENDQSYRYFMQKNLFDKTDISPENIFFPNNFAPDFESYDKKIDEVGGIDLQILGIGRNGHIGFNEPGSSFNSKAREIDLSEITIKDNSRFFEKIEDVPTKAITMGMGTIMKAKKIVLLANGENKAEIIKKAFFGPITEEVPASVLQSHKNVIIILDKICKFG